MSQPVTGISGISVAPQTTQTDNGANFAAAAQDAAASTATTQAAADPSQVASALLGAVGKALVTSLAPTILTQATKFKEWTDAEN
jgi:hypothetical protein